MFTVHQGNLINHMSRYTDANNLPENDTEILYYWNNFSVPRNSAGDIGQDGFEHAYSDVDFVVVANPRYPVPIRDEATDRPNPVVVGNNRRDWYFGTDRFGTSLRTLYAGLGSITLASRPGNSASALPPLDRITDVDLIIDNTNNPDGEVYELKIRVKGRLSGQGQEYVLPVTASFSPATLLVGQTPQGLNITEPRPITDYDFTVLMRPSIRLDVGQSNTPQELIDDIVAGRSASIIQPGNSPRLYGGNYPGRLGVGFLAPYLYADPNTIPSSNIIRRNWGNPKASSAVNFDIIYITPDAPEPPPVSTLVPEKDVKIRPGELWDAQVKTHILNGNTFNRKNSDNNPVQIIFGSRSDEIDFNHLTRGGNNSIFTTDFTLDIPRTSASQRRTLSVEFTPGQDLLRMRLVSCLIRVGWKATLYDATEGKVVFEMELDINGNFTSNKNVTLRYNEVSPINSGIVDIFTGEDLFVSDRKTIKSVKSHTIPPVLLTNSSIELFAHVGVTVDGATFDLKKGNVYRLLLDKGNRVQLGEIPNSGVIVDGNGDLTAIPNTYGLNGKFWNDGLFQFKIRRRGGAVSFNNDPNASDAFDF